jgi:hypothetical protein
MSIRADILQAKDEYHEHMNRHKCSLIKCQEKTELWGAWMGTAGLWATEPDDDDRQREHYNKQYGIH